MTVGVKKGFCRFQVGRLGPFAEPVVDGPVPVCFASDIGPNSSVYPCCNGRIRRPASSSISLTHAPCITSSCNPAPSLSDAICDFLHCLANFGLVGLA